jgi:iron complex transport system substrate-binding protein
MLLGLGGALLGIVSVTGCDRDAHEKSSEQTCGTVQFEKVGSDYFSIGKLCGVDVAVVRSVVGKDTLVHRFVMMDSSTASLGTDLRRRSFPEGWLSAKVLRIPLKRVAALSTSQVGYLLRLGLRDNIVGVSDGNYIVDSVLYERARPDHGSASDFVQSIGYDADALEKLMALHPDLIFDFTTGGDYDNYEQIARTSLPLMLTSEWQENSPLAKLEWIKLYGVLFGVRPLADSIYEQEKNKYETLKNLIASSVTNDSVNPKATGGRDLNIDERTDFQSYRRKTKENVSEENPSSKDSLSSLVSRLSSIF